jgi:hypothetical protein
MEYNQNRSKKMIFWVMLIAGILYFLSVLAGYFENNSLLIRDLIISVILIGLAISYKIYFKI